MEKITIIEILKYINELTDTILINTEESIKLAEFSQILAKTIIETKDMASNTFNTMSLIFEKMSSKLNYITNTQENIKSLLDLIINISRISIITDIIHSILIIGLVIYTMCLNRKINKVNNVK